MARKFATPIDLQQLEILRLRFHQSASDPPGGVEGQVYWNTASDKVMVHNGSAFIPLLASAITSADITDGTIQNVDVAALAAIAYTKLALANSIVNADINTLAAIAYTKLALANSIVNGDISPTAAIALSKLATDPLARANHTGTQLAATISNFDTQVRTNPMNLLVAPTADVAFNAKKITGLADPISAQDAATKIYVDNAIQGLDALQSVKAATTAQITLSAAQTVDGIALVAGDRCLVKNQTLPAENGVYVVAAGAWTRAPDNDTWLEMPGSYVWVEQGTTQADTGWVNTADQGGTLGTTAVTWVQFAAAGAAIAGAGLTKTGNTLDVVGTANRITVAADSVDISTAYVGQATITTLGTITVGTWNGAAIPVAFGGTGSATAPLARTALAVPGRYDNGAVHGSATTIVITAATHGLGTGRSKMVQVIEEASGDVVETDVNVAASGDVTVTFATAPLANTHRVLILGF